VQVRHLLAAAALLVLTLTAVSAFLLASQPRDERSLVVPPPPAPSVNPSIDASVLPHFAGTEVWSATGRLVGPDVYMTVADGVAWLTQSGPNAEPPKVVRIDPTGAVTSYDLPGRLNQAEYLTRLGPPAVGAHTLYFTVYSSREDGSGPTQYGVWRMNLVTPGAFAEDEFAAGTGRDEVDERGENWFQHERTLSLRRADGSTQWNVPLPWDASEDTAYNQLSTGTAFGSVTLAWANSAAVDQGACKGATFSVALTAS